MALAVQTKPRPQGSDPDTRKNSKLQEASVLHANTILTLALQQELSKRTGSSSSVLDFSLGDNTSDALFLTILPVHLFFLLILLVVSSPSSSSSSTDRCWFVWQALGPSHGSECQNPSGWGGSWKEHQNPGSRPCTSLLFLLLPTGTMPLLSSSPPPLHPHSLVQQHEGMFSFPPPGEG